MAGKRRQRTAERAARLAGLVEVYGGLLTPHQLEILKLHCVEQLSLSDIARRFGVSRQAIHDAVHKAEAILQDYEVKLGVFRARAPGLGPGGTLIADVVQRLEKLRARVARSGIIYSPDWISAELADIIRGLAESSGTGPEAGPKA